MKKLAFLLVVLGSGLTALGLSCWELYTSKLPTLGDDPVYRWEVYAGWTVTNRLEIAVGVMLLVCGLLLRRDQRPNAP